MKTIPSCLGTAIAFLFLFSPAGANEVSDFFADLDWNWKSDPAEFDGVTLSGADLSCRFGGRLAVDAIHYDHRNDRAGGLAVSDARLVISGNYRAFEFRIEPDLIGVDTPRHLYEAWGGFDIIPEFRLAVGQIRVALGSEYATREEDLPFFGYGFTSYLDGRYDTGIRADGDFFNGRFWYEAAAATGHGFGLEGRRRQNPQYSLRLVAHPFQWFNGHRDGALDGFFAGIGLAKCTDGDEPIVVATPLESVVFRTPDLGGDSARWRHFEVGYVYGPFRAGWERVVGSTEDVPVAGGGVVDMDQLTAWSFFSAVNLTGETQVWERGRWTRPARKEGSSPFLGRWEAAVRYSNADIDRNLFSYGITTYNPSTQEVRTFSLALNWYPDERTRVGVGWVKTIADHELGTFGGDNRDSSLLLRVEFAF